MNLVRLIVFVTVLSNYGNYRVLMPLQVLAAGSTEVYADREIHMVVGDQQVIEGDFDSQLTFSKKGLVNIHWLNDHGFLLTALKSGVLIIDPTPISKTQRRFLIKIKTVYQAQRDTKNRNDQPIPKGFDRSTGVRYFDPLQGQRFKDLLLDRTHNKIIMDCYHPHKQEFVVLLRRFHPTVRYSCELKTYQLDISFGAVHFKDSYLDEPRRALERGLPAPSMDQSKVAKYHWRVDVYPSTSALQFKMNHKILGMQIRDLAYYSSPRAGVNIVSFDYEFSVDGVAAAGHVAKPYELGQQMLLSELVVGENSEQSFKDLVFEGIPFVGFWLAAHQQSAQRSLWQMWVKLLPELAAGQPS